MSLQAPVTFIHGTFSLRLILSKIWKCI